MADIGIDEFDDYESLPTESTMSTHMMAGALAGIMEHSVMYPVDCVKTRMQCLVPNEQANYRNLYDAFSKIIRYEGLRKTVRGVSAMVSGAGPAHAMYFACYEKIKKTISGTPQGNAFATGVAGCAATVLHDLVMNPAEVVKQRMQVYGSPYTGCINCASTVLKTEGMHAFYRSFTTQLTMNIPFQVSHFMVYESMQDVLNHERQYNPTSHIVSGAMAGACAAAITTPLDVCKTLLNTQERCVRGNAEINGMAHAIRTIYQFHGFRGYFKGLTPRIVYQMPSTAISWTVYEFFKYFITKQYGGESANCDPYLRASSVTPVTFAATEPLHTLPTNVK